MKTKRIAVASSMVVAVFLLSGALFLPASGAAIPPLSGCFPIHEVQADDTAEMIAEIYGITVEELLAANELASPEDLYAGQELCIPTGEALEVTGMEATGEVTETLAVEAVPITPEGILVRPPAGIPTRICVEGRVIDKKHGGIAGIQVTASTGMLPGKPVVTDAKGNFTFTNLTPGKWVFRVAVPDGWKPVTAQEITVNLGYGHPGCYKIRFKLDPRGCIIARKTDEGGKPLAGWTIRVSDRIDPVAGKTGANGEVIFSDLLPGTYVVSEDVPYPWKALTPSQVTVQVKPAWADDDCAVVTFKNQRQPTGCVAGTKIDDNHKPLGGWTIYAQPVDASSPVTRTITKPDGSFVFPELTLGTWTIWEEVPDWWTPITAPRFNVTLEKASAYPQCISVRFKNRPPDLCAEGYKVDEKGKGLAGWTVIAYPALDPTQSMQTTTDAHGYYRFNGLTLGEWVFQVEHQVGWKPIGADSVKIPIVGGRHCTQVPIFRNQSPRGCIEVIKKDDEGAGLPGWNITIRPKAGGPSQHGWTDGTGMVKFQDLPLGKYEVWEELQAGWAPVSPTKFEVELVAADKPVCARVRFVNKQVPRDICIDGYKIDQVDNVGLPDWPVSVKNLATGAVLETTTDGIGYFRFSNLAPGKYQVTVGDKEGWHHVGPASQIVTVTWPPKDTCTTVKFFNRQGPPPVPPDPPDPPGDCRAQHRVVLGDQLNRIAARYGSSIRAIALVNGIRNPDVIYPGQVLCIP